MCIVRWELHNGKTILFLQVCNTNMKPWVSWVLKMVTKIVSSFTYFFPVLEELLHLWVRGHESVENTTLDVTTVLRLPLWWGLWTNKTRKKYLNKMKWQKRKKENKNSICPRMLLFMQSELFRETFTSLLLTFTSFTCSANWNPPVSLPRGHQKWWVMAWGITLSVQFFHSGSSIPIFKDMELSQRSQI